MKIAYDKYYRTENLFGKPYPELMDFFFRYSKKGSVLDLGCGQGRDSIPLARLGFDVTGIDYSKVGIEQMNQISKTENLKLKGITADIFKFNDFTKYDFILLDSMFHFTKNDRTKETDFIKRIIRNAKKECLLVFCIQDTGKKVEILNEALNNEIELEQVEDQKLKYIFKENGHNSESDYRMIVVRK